MSFSEDPTSPAAPFSGDGSGQIFDLPDMVAASPTTSERIVDTQSGFLVVIKRLNDQLALSIKRHIGTPPGSSVSLTPDESLKLSRILASSFSLTDEWNSPGSKRQDRRTGRERRRQAASSAFAREIDDEATIPDLEVDSETAGSTPVPVKLMLASVLRTYRVPLVGIALSAFVIGIGAGITGLKLVSPSKATVAADVHLALADPLDSKKVDSFVRDFTARMLDFTAKTYRVSQVQAMAAMSPDLLERYWQETKFPLSRRQLSALPHNTSVVITDLKQTRLDTANVLVDVHAQILNAANPKVFTPVDLRLKLSTDNNHQIVVVDQQDLSSAAHR
jgi:hypothetical protein